MRWPVQHALYYTGLDFSGGLTNWKPVANAQVFPPGCMHASRESIVSDLPLQHVARSIF